MNDFDVNMRMVPSSLSGCNICAIMDNIRKGLLMVLLCPAMFLLLSRLHWTSDFLMSAPTWSTLWI